MTLVASAMISMTRCDLRRRHQLKGAGINEVSHQHAGLIAVDLIGGVAPAAPCRHVDHVVMQQCCGVDELDEGGGLDAARVPVPPQARPASTTSRGRSRLPPPPMMCSAI